ncbi:OadG family protein [Fusobacterium necrophorum]|uniref:OadG family protein n=1 Tax=Fusobacterium necrophorum TaxID=859 RepID=UPI00370EB34E
MITTEYIGFLESLLTSLLGISIVFLSLVFLAIFVTVVSRVIAVLEKTLLMKEPEVKMTAQAAEETKKDKKEALKIAVITAAISEERREPIDRFVITNIQKM